MQSESGVGAWENLLARMGGKLLGGTRLFDLVLGPVCLGARLTLVGVLASDLGGRWERGGAAAPGMQRLQECSGSRNSASRRSVSRRSALNRLAPRSLAPNRVA